MGWERRKRGGRYYTRSRKVGGRVVREYVGTGPIAEAAAALDELDRLDREEQAMKTRAERERLESEDTAAAGLDGITTVLTRAVLVAAGFHQHHRGEWRRRRREGQTKDSRWQPRQGEGAYR